MSAIVEVPNASPPLNPKPLLAKIPRETVAELCQQFGSLIPLAETDDGSGHPIDGAKLLWAISGCESTFGDHCEPRFERAYYSGGYYYLRDKRIRQAVQMWGRDAACSYGPWQVLCINTQYSPEQLGSDPKIACDAAVHFIVNFVLGFRKARTLSAVLDTYNSGNWRDVHVPVKYIHDGTNYYQGFPMP